MRWRRAFCVVWAVSGAIGCHGFASATNDASPTDDEPCSAAPCPLSSAATCTPERVDARPVVEAADHGVFGRAHRVDDASIAAGSTTLSSKSAHFGPDDVDQPIIVAGASKGRSLDGTLVAVAGAPLTTTIVRVIDANRCELAASASVSVSSAPTVWGPDETAAMQKLLDDVGRAGGGHVHLAKGTYRIGYPGLHVQRSNIHLSGDGDETRVVDASIVFDAKRLKNGEIVSDQRGVPVLYFTAAKPGAEGDAKLAHEEVDHLALEDLGQAYDYGAFGPEGPAVLGTQTPTTDGSTRVDDVSFHDLLVRSDYLCGIGLDATSDGVSIHGVRVFDSANHGMYLTGHDSNLEVCRNTIRGTTRPMRIGIVLKAASHASIVANDVSDVSQAAIWQGGDSLDLRSTDVLIARNHLHDLFATQNSGAPFNTYGVEIDDADRVVIAQNVIERTNFSGIGVLGGAWPVTNVTIERNVLDRVGRQDVAHPPAIGIAPFGCGAPPLTSCGTFSGFSVIGNRVTNSAEGLFLVGADGTNVVRDNVVIGEGAAPPDEESCDLGFVIAPATTSTTTFSGNVGTSCARYRLVGVDAGSSNSLH